MEKTILKRAMSSLGIGAILLLPQKDHKISVVRSLAYTVSKDEYKNISVQVNLYDGYYAVVRVLNPKK